MKLIDIDELDFVNYKKPCMTIMFPHCSFKCNIEAQQVVCHNYPFRDADLVEMSAEEIVTRYLSNPMSEAIVMQGLEPFDSYEDLTDLIVEFTERCNDDIVIYTGYRKDEIINRLDYLRQIVKSNKLIVKFGRYIPDSIPIRDEVLGVKLASDNQYAEVIVDGGN